MNHAAHGHRSRGHLTLEAVMDVVIHRYLLFPLGAAIALVWANTAPDGYFVFAHRFSFVVNEVGMAFFFALLTQEIVEALMPGGALHSWRRWGMSVVAAAGGAAGAAGAYLLYVHMKHEIVLASAWPIACAIDAAAAYYVLKAIMPRSGALPFALLVAIITDVGGMIVVAPRYPILEARVGGTVLMTTALLLAALMRAKKVRAFWPYFVFPGAIAWMAFYLEGLHPAFALIPIVPFLPHEPRPLDLFSDPPDDDAVHHAEHEWHLLVQVVVFLFGLVNAGVILGEFDTGSTAMIVAQLVGRPAGMLIAAGIGVAAGLHLPRRVGWRELLIIALATSSGFSISLFFATGMLAPGAVLTQVKLGLIAASFGALLAFAAARLLRAGRFT